MGLPVRRCFSVEFAEQNIIELSRAASPRDVADTVAWWEMLAPVRVYISILLVSQSTDQNWEGRIRGVKVGRAVAIETIV